LVTSSNLVAATIPLKSSLSEQGIRQNQQAYLATKSEQGISVSKAIEELLFDLPIPKISPEDADYL
jgi:hypothetical protein